MKNDFPPFRLTNPQHEALRQELLARYRTSSYMCGAFTAAFAARFPDLKRVPGYYLSAPNGASHGQHWWLVDTAGAIVDPTADQFPTREFGHYVPYDPRVHCLPKGKCPGCGGEVYASEGGLCSPECDRAMANDLEIPGPLHKGPYECDMEFETDMDLVTKYGCQFTSNPWVAAAIAAALAESAPAAACNI